jgi:hypothetical protein
MPPLLDDDLEGYQTHNFRVFFSTMMAAVAGLSQQCQRTDS